MQHVLDDREHLVLCHERHLEVQLIKLTGGTIRTRILALHGDADPYVPQKQVDAFLAEMREAKPDWQLVSFGGAVHSFTDPDANLPGQAMYDAKIARRAFEMADDFLDEAFAAK